MDQAVSQNKCFIIYRTTAAENYVVCRITAQVVKLKMHVLQLLNVQNSQQNVAPAQHEARVAQQVLA